MTESNAPWYYHSYKHNAATWPPVRHSDNYIRTTRNHQPIYNGLFDKDFETYKSNYNDDFFTKAFYDSVSITLDKDNITIIGNRSYNYFKKTMENKLQYYIELEVNELLGK